MASSPSSAGASAAAASPRRARILRIVGRTGLILIGGFWSVFALLSGAERFGGGLEGLLRNSPNAAPWLALLAIAAIAFRWERAGGLLAIAAGLALAVLFHAWREPFVLLAIIAPIIGFGLCLVLAAYLDRAAPPK